MSVSLASRLVLGGLASEDDVERALLGQLTGAAPFLRAVVERAAGAARALELRGARSGPLEVDAELASRVPPGASETLLAVPIGRDPATGVVVVAAADALDRHVAAELQFHIGEPVMLVAAELDAVLSAIAAAARPSRVPPDGPQVVPRAGEASTVSAGSSAARGSGRTPSQGTPVQGASPPRARPSEPPIPLVRVAPSLVPKSPDLEARASGSGELVLPLTRSKATRSVPGADDDARVVSGLREAGTADGVLSALLEALRARAKAVVAFGVRGSVYRGRDAVGDVDADAARRVEVDSERPSILRTATEIGHYLGPIPITDAHRELAELLGEHGGEVAVHAIMVGPRPVTVVVLGGMENAFQVTARAERLVRAAGEALEDLVRARKR